MPTKYLQPNIANIAICNHCPCDDVKSYTYVIYHLPLEVIMIFGNGILVYHTTTSAVQNTPTINSKHFIRFCFVRFCKFTTAIRFLFRWNVLVSNNVAEAIIGIPLVDEFIFIQCNCQVSTSKLRWKNKNVYQTTIYWQNLLQHSVVTWSSRWLNVQATEPFFSTACGDQRQRKLLGMYAIRISI